MAGALTGLGRSAVRWVEASVRRRLTAAMLAVTLVFTLLVGAASFWMARWQLRKNLDDRLQAEALLEARRVGYPLTTVAATVASLARNGLVARGLADAAGRHQYLAPFLRDFRPSEGLEVTLTLCDAQGRAIASSAPGHPGYEGATWIRAVVDVGLPNVAVAGDRRLVLLLAEPVARPGTGVPDGALVAELDLGRALTPGGASPFRARIADGARRVLADNGGSGEWKDLLVSSAAVAGAPLLQELGLRVEVGTPQPPALGALWRMMVAYALGALLLTGAAVAVASVMADRLTRPVLRLSGAAAAIAERGSAEGGVPVEGRDEVARLAQVFNEVLRRLAQATEARVAALHERNQELVRSHAQAERLQLELHQAQKLEAVGRLAAGIAHEINTPIQYIGDNTRFLAEAFTACTTMLDRQQQILQAHAPAADLAQLEQDAEDADLAYIRQQTDRTVQRTLQGVERVASIVRAMKEFAHPDQKAMVATDLNRALQATLEVARNEYKYVADVETAFGEIPLVTCHAGDVNQVFLNIVVNAAHAIGDVVKGSGGRGVIRVATAREGQQVKVSISDTGGGIPDAIRDKVFDPFFTTKEVGVGTGQGLAIARSIVDKHGGAIRFDSAPGQGTTFHILLPETPRVQAAGSTA